MRLTSYNTQIQIIFLTDDLSPLDDLDLSGKIYVI